MATVGIPAGFVEEATFQIGEKRVGKREGQEQGGACAVAPGDSAKCWMESGTWCQDVVCTFSL